MNRHCYRVIFNKTLARLVVVSEKTHSHSKTNSQGGSQNNVVLTDSQQNLLKNGYYGKLKLTFALILLSLGIINICHANPNTTATTVVADSSANKHLQPMIVPTASGMVSVNIQTPNDKGLSNNHYSQFDVGSQGVILNNNRKAVATQLAGFVDANPFMARGEASTILNQVNSNKASMLNGFVEVAGQKADVIIANPNGLQINGAGFINAANVHLVSGVAQVYDGKPSAYHVGTGAIVASGKLNAGHTDYTALIAKSMQLNDEIYAGKQLDVITGENLINIQDGKLNQLSATSKQASSSQTNQTANNTAQGVALDISALGGMYAGSIRLIGTNQGLGVNNAGIILSTGNDGASPLSLDIKGNLINTGTIAGKDKLQINTSTLENLGTINSESGNIALTTNHLNNSGTIFSSQVNQITASHHINNQGDIYGGAFDIATNSLNNAGKLIQTGKGQLIIKSDTLTNTNQAVIGQSLYHKTTVDMADPPSTAQTSGGVINTKANHTNSSSNTQPSTPIATPVANGSITTQTLTNQDKNALIAAAGGIDIAADTSINQNQSSIDVQSLSTKTLSNTNSKLAVNNINWHLTHFDNTQGTLASKQDIVIAAQNSIINQQGILAGNGKLELSTEGDVDNHQGVIQSAQGNAIILAQNIQNSQGSITASDTLSIMATDTLNNTQGNISAQGDATLTIGTTLNNTDGSIQSAKALTANTQNLSNSGQLYAAKTTLAASKHLVNNKTGIIASAGDVDILSDTISNTGSVIAGMKADGALLATPANLTVHATKELSSSGVHVATNHLQLGGNALTLTDSQSQAKNITLNSKSTTSTQHAKVAATDVLNMVTPDLLNNTQGMLSASNINIHTEKLNNHQGSINQSSQDDFSLTLKNGLDNRQGSITANAQNFNIHTSTLNNHQGHIKHTGAILNMTAADVNNTQGSILSTGDHTLNVKDVINNHQGIIQANTLTTTAKQLDNSDGKLLTSHHQSLTLTNDINNHQGLIQAGDFTITAKQLNNHQGILLATDDKNQNRINLTGELNNTNTVQKAATIAAAGNLLMTASKLQNTGNISSQTLGIQADKIHHAGNITSQTNVVIKGVLGIENTQTSSVFAGGDVILSSQSGITHHGQLTAVNHLSVDAAQLDLSGSTNQAANISYTSKADIAHQHATSSATNSIVINNTNGIFSNQQGNITAKTVNLDSKALQNGGSIYAKALTVHQIDDYTHAKQDKLIADNLNFNTQGGFTNQGQLSANQALSLTAKSITNSKDATINAANLTHLDSQSYLNNQGLINGNATYIKAKNAINNRAGGRIYGTHLAIAADTLNNTPAKIHDTDATNTAPVIAARQRLDIGVNYLNNHPNPDRHAQFNQDFLGQALITSLGSLHIGGGLNDNYHAIGKAQKIVNRGATTQSGGQMLIDTKVLKNENAHFEKVAQVIDRQDRQIFYRNRENPSRVYGSHEAFLGPTSKKGAPTGALYIKDAHGNHHRVGEEIDEITVDLVVYKDHTRWSDPARMVAGQDLITYGNQLINDKSQMNAGAGFAMTGDKVVQTPDGGLIGQTIKMAENGNFVSRTVVSSAAGRRHKRIDIGSGPYTQTFAPLETYELPILNATITTTPSKPTINQVALADSDIDAALEALKSNQSALSTDAQKQLSALLATKALGQTVDKALLAALINKLPQKIGGKTPTVVHATPDGLSIPNSALYTINANHPNLPIIQTDPAFTNHKNWLSSEYMLTKLDIDANHIEKRLGDGYYEQKQLQDQYQLLTGRHLLSDYQSQEQAFKTLMDQGITFAKQYQLSLGVALSAKQMAHLTTDMVWLVKQPITYTKKDKEGNLITHTQEALVPKLYLRPANTATARLQPDGRYSSIGAKNINMHLTGNLDNSGNITATDALSIQANNATNKGNINAKFVAIDVNQDLINQHRIHADHAAALTAGHDIINQSQTSQQSQKLGQSSASSTHIRQLAQISVGDGAKATGKDGKTPTTLSIKAGNYVIYTGANSQNQGGNTLISANKGIRLDAIKESSTINAIADDNNYFKHSQSKDIGSAVSGQGDVVLVTTGQDAAITGKAVNISSQAGKVRMSATGDIRFEEGRQTDQLQIATQFTDKGLISKKTTNHQHHADEDKALTNTIQAEQITLTAGKNLQLTASNIASDTHIHLKAKGDVVLDAAINSQDSQTHTHTKKSGMFASSATTITLGKQTTKTDDNHQKITHTGNQLAALGGNVIIEAGDQYEQIASDIYAADNTKTINNPDAGNVLIKAQEAHISGATNTNTNHNAFYQKTSGITASVSSSMVDSTKSIDGLIDATQESQSTRLKAMGALAAAAKTKNLLDQIKQGSLGSIRAQATLGTSTNKNQSTSSHQSNQASTINTDGNLIFDIQGKGTDSDLVITGSHINVGNNLYQKVAGDVIYQASSEHSNTSSSHDSKSAGVGVYASANLSQTNTQGSAGFTAHANLGKGSSTETATTHTNTTVKVAGTTHNDIKGNFTLDGANLTTKHLTGAVGGDLIVKSRQDTYQYDSKQQNIGGSADIDFSGKLQNANINTGKQQLNAQYAQITNQSGIIANTSDLNVQGQGKFTAGYLITDKDQNHTQFKQGIQTQDIENHLNYQGDALQVGISLAPKSKSGQQDSTSNKTKHQLGLSGLGYGKIDPIHKISITKSAITDQAGLNHINTDNLGSEDSQQTLNPIISNDFTNQKSQLEKELGNQVTITTEFGREIPKQIGDYAQAKEIELLAQGNIEEAKKWAEGGVYRVALHTAMGALATGTAEGAFAAGAAASAAPKLNHLQAKLKQKLNEQGLESDTAEMISQSVLNLTLVGVGASAGLDTGSTAYALNTDVNNRQLHPVEFDAIQIIAEKLGIDEEELKKAVLYHIDKGWQDNINEKEAEKVAHYQSLYKQALNELNGRSIDEYLINALSKSNYDEHSLEGPYVELPPMYITISRTAHSRNFEADKTNRYLEQEGIAFQATDADFNDGRIFAAKSFGEIKDRYPSLVQDMSAFEKLQEASDGLSAFGEGFVEGGVSNIKGLADAITNLPNTDISAFRERAHKLSSDIIKYTTDSQYRDSVNQEAAYDLKTDIAYGQILALQGDADKIGQTVGEASGKLVADLALSAATAGVGKVANQAIKTINKVDIPDKKITNYNPPSVRAIECSFHGDMQVKTLFGYKPISQIQIADWVFAKNEITGKTNYRQVLQTINSIDPDTTHITIVNSDGVKQTIISDGLHPYFVDFTGDTTPPKPSTGHHYKGNLPYAYWVGAKDIEIGHRLIDDKGNYQTVIAIHTKSTPLDSYNLEVDTDHTFFIKGIDGVDAVWVHNKDCWIDIPKNARKTQIGNDTVYEFDDNGRTVKVIENPKFSEEGGAKFFEVKVTGKDNKQKVAIIKQNKPDITRDINSNNTIVAQQGKKSNWNQYLNKPEPNKRIVIAETGHIYHTDSKSRVSLVEAELRKHQNDRNTNQQCKSGGCERLPTDHGGHLIASMFDGLGEGINIVPMDAKLNGVKGQWYETEKKWKNALENNGTVQVKIELIYSGHSKRPHEFIIIETINGKELIKHLKNTPTGE